MPRMQPTVMPTTIEVFFKILIFKSFCCSMLRPASGTGKPSRLETVSMKPESQMPVTPLTVFPIAMEHMVVTPKAIPSFESIKSPDKIMMALSKKPKATNGMIFWRAYVRICSTVGSGISDFSATPFPDLVASSCATAGVTESCLANASSLRMSVASCLSSVASTSTSFAVVEVVSVLRQEARGNKFIDLLWCCSFHAVMDNARLRQAKLLLAEGIQAAGSLGVRQLESLEAADLKEVEVHIRAADQELAARAANARGLDSSRQCRL